MGREAQVTQGGDYRSCGPAQRSLFLRRPGHLNNFQFTGEDFFADKTFAASCWKYPNSALGRRGWPMGPHADSGKRRGYGLGPSGARRAAQPNSNSLPARRTLPTWPESRRNDAPSFSSSRTRWSIRVDILRREQAGGRDLLPDILALRPHAPRVLPEQCRALNDDVSDVFLGILTNGVTGDKVGPQTIC